MNLRYVIKEGGDLVRAAQLASAVGPRRIRVDGWYARYTLGVLLIVYILSLLDRQILAILAEDIKADLGISDADLGFLFGTAFAVFYATFGIALGRLADVWNRCKLIAIGLSFWSLMTALSGTARSFLPLAVYRFGVAVGEASASPAAFSLIYDCFSAKVRTTAVAIYSSGVYIGAGLGLFLGGMIVDAWKASWPDPGLAPFGLQGWQAALMIVGLPGLVMALWVSTLREPIRGAGDGIVGEPHPHPFRESLLVLASMLPIANLWVLISLGQGRKAIVINTAIALAIVLVAWVLILFTGSVLQWIAVAIGVYAAVSWAQTLALRDPVIFNMIFKCRTLCSLIFAGGTTTFMGVAIGFWSIPFFQRHYGVSASELGALLGPAAAVLGFSGVVLGGILADKLRPHTPRGKLYVWLAGAATSLLSALLLLLASDLTMAYLGIFLLYLTGPLGHAPSISTINDLVLPRGRATASAFGLLVATFVGIALGPYVTGHISDAIAATEVGSGEALRQAMLWSLAFPVVGIILVTGTLAHIETDEANLLGRARLLGEKV